MIRRAALLTQNHIGHRITYGPFTGILDHVQHLTEEWLGWHDARPIPTPPRVFVRTVDGRCCTFAYDHEVRLEAIRSEEERVRDRE